MVEGPVELPADALAELLDTQVMHALLDPDGTVLGPQDWPMRRAEAFETIEIVAEGAGRRFESREQARRKLFTGANGGGFGIRLDLVETVLGMLRSPIPPTLEELASLVPTELRHKPGTVFNSGRRAFTEPGPLYLLGINPGGDPLDVSHGTIQQDISAALDRSDANWSAFRDKQWGRRAPGTDPMQKRVLRLLDQLNLDPATVPASNVVFVRTRDVADLREDQIRLEEVCWQFHAAVISRLDIKVVVCLGKDAGHLVRRKLAAFDEWGPVPDANDRRPASRGYSSPSGIKVIVAPHPSRFPWTTPPGDPGPLVEGALRT